MAAEVKKLGPEDQALSCPQRGSGIKLKEYWSIGLRLAKPTARSESWPPARRAYGSERVMEKIFPVIFG